MFVSIRLMLNITAIPAFNDNYIWLLDNGQQAAIVDPGDAAPVIAALEARGLTLTTILITHHHRDHTGGIAALRDYAPAITVYYPKQSETAWGNVSVQAGDVVTLKEFDLCFQVLEIPGHTLDHVAYFCANAEIPRSSRGMTAGLSSRDTETVSSRGLCPSGCLTAGSPLLFCGDTLFAAGCGRVFEGTYPQMYDSLMQLKNLPDNTLVFCAHEYTLSNLKFAMEAEPNNTAIAERLNTVEQLREANQITLPSTIALEKQTNVFLRSNSAEHFQQLREQKNLS